MHCKTFFNPHELLASPPIRNSTNTTTSTTSSTITHPLSCMIVTTTYSTINTTIPAHTLRHQPTAATLPTSTTPLSPNTFYNASPSPSPIHTHPSSTSAAKTKSTPTFVLNQPLFFKKSHSLNNLLYDRSSQYFCPSFEFLAITKDDSLAFHNLCYVAYCTFMKACMQKKKKNCRRIIFIFNNDYT